MPQRIFVISSGEGWAFEDGGKQRVQSSPALPSSTGVPPLPPIVLGFKGNTGALGVSAPLSAIRD